MYCNYKEQTRQTVPEVLASLLKQLVQDHLVVSDDIQSLYNRHVDNETRPAHEELMKTLQLEIATYTKVFIIVDALDEFLERDQVYLMTELKSLSGAINLMVTSRPLPLIEEYLRDAEHLDIRAKDEDIKNYIEDRIQYGPRLARLVKTNGTLQESVVNKVSVNVNGMYVFPIFVTSIQFLFRVGFCWQNSTWTLWSRSRTNGKFTMLLTICP